MIEELILKERRKKRQRSLCMLIIITVAVCYLLFNVVFGISIVEGSSMEAGIPEGSVVIYNRLEKSCDVNDIVIVHMDEKLIIKRIFFKEEDGIFLLGDNLQESVDSRSFGRVSEEQIVGKVICVIRFLA